MLNTVIQGDCLEVLKGMQAESVHTCVTSPPYFGLRDYGVAGQIGLEQTSDEFVSKLVAVFREVRRVLKADGTLWLNLGDSYAGSWGAQSRPNGNDALSTLQGGSMLSARQIKEHPKRTNTGSLKNTPGCKPKDLIGIPWMVAFALRADGWYLRQDIIWHKPNPMPESVTDRCTKSHEYIFLLSKSERYYFDQDSIREKSRPSSIARVKTSVRFGGNKQCPDTRLQSGKEWKPRQGGSGFTPEKRDSVGAESGTANKRSVWSVTTQGFKEAHFATFPPKLIVPCIKAGAPEGGIVLDPFFGAGTTGLVAKKLNRNFIGIELNPDYVKIAERRIREVPESLFATGT